MAASDDNMEVSTRSYPGFHGKEHIPVIDLTGDTDDGPEAPSYSTSRNKEKIPTVADLTDKSPLRLDNGIKTDYQEQDSDVDIKGLPNLSSTLESGTDQQTKGSSATTTPNMEREVETNSLFVSEDSDEPPSEPKPQVNTGNAKSTTKQQGRKRKTIVSNTSAGGPARKKRRPAAQASVNKLKGKKTGSDMLKSLFGKRPNNADETEESFPKPRAPSNPKADEKALNEAIKIFGNNCHIFGKEPNGSNDTFITSGMKTPLRDYQLVGAAFMLRHEKAREGPRGGIIADEMGLGKTLQAIACMLAHKPSAKDRDGGNGTTLIVMPSDNLITQWLAEFDKHIDSSVIKKPLHYKQRVGMADHALKTYEFIFTTYAQIQVTYKNAGPLFEIEFYRIILDEADKIKNMKASTSIACRGLRAKQKWALSGTPLPNSLDEILPYMAFIGINGDNIQGLGHTDEDQHDIPKPRRLNMKGNEERIMKVINDRMLRREKGEMFNGRQICELPASHESACKIKMTEEESLIYRCIEATTLRLLREAIDRRRAGTEQPNDYRLRYFVLLTRLRQAVDHPLLLYTWMKNIIPADVIRKLLEDLANIEPKTSVYDQIVASSEDLLSKMSKVKPEQSDSNPQGFGIDKPDVFFRFEKHLNHVLDSKDNDGCITCSQKSDVVKLECGHLLCHVCLTEQVEQRKQQGECSLKCPECDAIIFHIEREETPEVDDAAPTLFTKGGRVKLSQPSAPKPPVPGDDCNGFQPKTKRSISKWLELSDRHKNEPLIPSAKTTAAMECIKRWQLESPGDKIIVFVQWAITAKVIGRMLETADIPFLYYWGDMTPQQRGTALEDFNTNDEIKVLVAGLKCGNQGLNITCANRAILLSPWWNRSVEDQAKGRIYRHGQTKETHIVNIVVEKSIDDRLLYLQRQKTEQTEPAMSQGRAAKQLTDDERLWLFGWDEASSH